MRLVKYKVSRLNEPEESITHQVIYETITKNNGTGGFGYGMVFKGSYKQCIKRKKELENENAETRGARVPREKQNNK